MLCPCSDAEALAQASEALLHCEGGMNDECSNPLYSAKGTWMLGSYTLYHIPSLESHLHEMQHLLINICFTYYAQVMVILLGAGNLGDLTKAQVIFIRLIKREYNVHKIFS